MRSLINVPKTARAGDVIEIKTMIAHPMETGYRTGTNGTTIPRKIITRFVCLYDGEEIFSAELFPAVAANPLIAFTTVAVRSGTLTFTWTEDGGATHTETADIVVA